VLLAGCASGESARPGAAGVVRVKSESGWNGTPVRNGYPLPAQRGRDTSGTSVVPAADVDAPRDPRLLRLHALPGHRQRRRAYEAERGAYVTGFVDGRARVVWSETTSVRAHRADLRRLQSNTT